MIRILGIEGWGDFRKIQNLLAIPLLERFHFQYQHCEWQEWPKYLNDPWDVVIGHSLGGDSSVRFCKSVVVQKKQPVPKLLITCAPRYQTDVKSASLWDWFVPYDSLQTMTAPIPNTHNFWTPAPLPSAPMVGAVENVNVASILGGIWHGNVPGAPAVIRCLEKFLRANNA